MTVTQPSANAAATTPAIPKFSAPSPKSAGGKSRSVTPKPKANIGVPAHTQCEANIRVKTATTMCRFGENVFVAYWASQNYDNFPVSAYSPAAGPEFNVSCGTSAGRVTCTAGEGAEITFSQRTVAAYTLGQAKHYVGTSDVGDEVFPWEHDAGDETPSATPSSPSPAPDYSSPGSVPDTSSTPPGGNIPNYDNGNGYRLQCNDGTLSRSGGIQGACSHHGGWDDQDEAPRA